MDKKDQPSQKRKFGSRARRRLNNSSETSSSSATTLETNTSTPATVFSPSDRISRIAEGVTASTASDRQEPGNDEIRHYYAGLPSKPLLLARTGTDSWPPTAPPMPLVQSLRHGTTQDPPVWTQETVRKHLGPIDGPFPESKHPLIPAWPKIRDEIVAVLSESPLKHAWCILFPTRITTIWEDWTASSKVTVLVGASLAKVQEAASSEHLSVWAVALMTVGKCQRVLQDHGFAGIEVEAYETEVFPLAGSRSSPGSPTSPGSSTDAKFAEMGRHDIDQYFDLMVANKAGKLCENPILHHSLVAGPSLFLNRPGQKLERTRWSSNRASESYRNTGSTGSLGLYLALSPKSASLTSRSGKVFALTSRHVAIGENVGSDVTFSYSTTQGGEDDKMMVLWGEQRALELGADQLDEDCKSIDDHAKRLLKGVSPQQTDTEDADTLHSYIRATLKPLSEAMRAAAVSSYGSGEADDASQPKRREVGHVVASARHGLTKRQTWSDWALVELTESGTKNVLKRQSANEFLVSVVLAAEFSDHIAAQHPNVFSFFKFLTDTCGTMRISGTRHPGSIRIPTDVSDMGHQGKDKGKAPANASTDTDIDTNTDAGHLLTDSEYVFKSGATTSFTMGLTNEVEAVVRMPLGDGKDILAYNLLIYPTVTKTDTQLRGYTSGTFSARGDSGSAVVGIDGCVVAMIDAGASSSELGRLFCRPPEVLPTADEDVKAQARAAHKAAALGEVSLTFRPANIDVMPGVIFEESPSVDVTLATPIDWVLEDIEETLGESVYLA